MMCSGTFDELFSSKGRVKVLRKLLSEGEMNLSQLIRATGLNYVTVTKHLKYLKEVGLVEELRIGRARIYRPKWVNPRTRLLEELIRDFSD
jgi:DNA-binding transcriptional ArsR family regulator